MRKLRRRGTSRGSGALFFLITLPSSETHDLSSRAFVKPTFEDNQCLAGVVAIITCEVNFETSAHVPAKTGLPEIFGWFPKELLYLPGLCSKLLLAQAHAVP